MTTTVMTIAAGQEAIASAMAAMGYPARAIRKVMRVLENRAATRAPACMSANTDTKNTNSLADREEQDGAMLELEAKAPPAWVREAIEAGLEARGLDRGLWARAWSHFRVWNITRHKNEWIAMRALRKWLKTWKPGLAPSKPRKPVSQPPASSGGQDQAHRTYAGRNHYPLCHELEKILSKDEYMRRLEAEIAHSGCTRYEAATRLNVAALKDGTLSWQVKA